MATGSSSLIGGSEFICKARTLCRTILARFRGGIARGPVRDGVVSGTDVGGGAMDTDRDNDTPFGGAGLVAVETARRSGSVGNPAGTALLRGGSTGGSGRSVAGGVVDGARVVGDRPPTGRGDGGKLIRKTEPDRRRVGTLDGGGGVDVVVDAATVTSLKPVPLGVETSTPLGYTLRWRSR